MMLRCCSILFSVLILSGCAASTFYYQDGATLYGPMNPAQVLVYSGDDIHAKYSVIGSIAIDKVGDSEKALAYLKEKAAAHGANAVINVRLTKPNGFAGRTGLSGTAVRYLK